MKSRLPLTAPVVWDAVSCPESIPELRSPSASPSPNADRGAEERRKGVQLFPCPFFCLPWVAARITTVPAKASPLDVSRTWTLTGLLFSTSCLPPTQVFSTARNSNALFPPNPGHFFFRRIKGLSIDLERYLFALATAVWKFCKKHWVRSWKNQWLWGFCEALPAESWHLLSSQELEEVVSTTWM